MENFKCNKSHNYRYKSAFAKEIVQFLNYKTACGFKSSSYAPALRLFDAFCEERKISSPVFTKEDAHAWMKLRACESSVTQYGRLNKVKLFLTYLLTRGYQVFVYGNVRYQPSSFAPHIYTDRECELYFMAVDSCNGLGSRNAVQYPVLFRLLYCCGTRIGETLAIRKCDVDLEKGVIALKQTKGGGERYIVVGDDMKVLLRTFAEKRFHEVEEDGLIFTNNSGHRIDPTVIHDAHKQFLHEAGIPYLGEGKGPRIHDFRHHFAVYSFKRMADSGLDMYVFLPILAAYLGHENIRGTEHYVRLAIQHFPSIGEKMKDKVRKIFGDIDYEND